MASKKYAKQGAKYYIDNKSKKIIKILKKVLTNYKINDIVYLVDKEWT